MIFVSHSLFCNNIQCQCNEKSNIQISGLICVNARLNAPECNVSIVFFVTTTPKRLGLVAVYEKWGWELLGKKSWCTRGVPNRSQKVCDHLSSSLPNLANHDFMDCAICRTALSCWNRFWPLSSWCYRTDRHPIQMCAYNFFAKQFGEEAHLGEMVRCVHTLANVFCLIPYHLKSYKKR